MLKSMTGFGRATAESDGRTVTVELKSVNHRYLDLGFRMPRHIGFAEDAIKAVLTEKLARGHVDVYVFYRNARNDARAVAVDTELMKQYLIEARRAAAELEIKDDLAMSHMLRLPDVTQLTEAEEDRAAVAAVTAAATEEAAGQLIAMRESEGAKLKADFVANINETRAIAGDIAKLAPKVAELYKARLDSAIAAVVEPQLIDRQRLATEVALFADRASIDEELVRLDSHFKQFFELMDMDEPVGRRLDFLIQEMNREFNTIGSKANDGGITALVIRGKAQVEKLREQVQNVE